MNFQIQHKMNRPRQTYLRKRKKNKKEARRNQIIFVKVMVIKVIKKKEFSQQKMTLQPSI